ncbi:Cytochrome P450 [Apiospora kogelbergensis]|uniref:Cytochrome P450 n=1 Tax=Apiospora kogelbergensis TaxID=1337665 RepID=UPI0031312D7A
MCLLKDFPQDGLINHGFWILMTTILAYVIILVVYRLFLSPLARIPGPKLAEITGPIVRVTPTEVHFNDPEVIETVYPTTGRKTDKPQWVADRTGTPYSIVSTVEHDVHRRRRNGLNSFFSVASIRRLEPIIQERIAKMMWRLEVEAAAGADVQLHRVFKACASDVITTYGLGDSLDFLSMPDYGQAWFASTDFFFYLTHVFAVFPWFVQLVQFAPSWLVEGSVPSLRYLRMRQEWWMEKVREIRASPDQTKINRTIFAGILGSSLPDEEKTDIRLASESQLVIFAGEGTVAHTLTCAMYHLLANSAFANKLKGELSPLVSDTNHTALPTLSQVENLPYLNAVIQEAVRLHPGVMSRQVRVSPEEPITYYSKRTSEVYDVPPGTVVSMSPLITHMNPNYFEDPYTFDPERWVRNPSLSRWFMGFARGSRNCVGYAHPSTSVDDFKEKQPVR